MPLKKRLVHRDALESLGPFSRLAVHNAVHQGKGIAVGQNLGDLVGIIVQSHGSALPFL
ncbi:hypothetical protein SDC9_153172 [bioreactor metagenome]|uniref:Uncharacterized protein n=1 Tax=bioreactor metagenome TaxID=1076179 RepID=A0A645EV51_9ZZZZ